jgi:GTP-binding protein Era
VTRCGLVAVVGKPNVGKSTLLNRLVGEKLAIISPKPQSTRHRVTGLLARGDCQAIIVDTPGLLDPDYALQRVLRSEALAGLAEADVVAHVTSPEALMSLPLVLAPIGVSPPPNRPVLEIVNKADLLTAEQQTALAAENPALMFASALTGDGIDDLLDRLFSLLPEGPWLYDGDDLSAQNSRFFASEFIREAAFELLHEELPYSVHVEIEEFREERDPRYIRAVVYVERESQKGILLGAGGRQIRELGRAARLKIETLLAAKVYLDLWVKVAPRWRRDEDALKRFGYRLGEDSDR